MMSEREVGDVWSGTGTGTPYRRARVTRRTKDDAQVTELDAYNTLPRIQWLGNEETHTESHCGVPPISEG